MEIGLGHYLTVAACLFTLGTAVAPKARTSG